MFIGRNQSFGWHFESWFQQVRIGGLWITRHMGARRPGWTIWFHQTRVL